MSATDQRMQFIATSLEWIEAEIVRVTSREQVRELAARLDVERRCLAELMEGHPA